MGVIKIGLSVGDITYATIEAVERYNFNRANGGKITTAAKTWPEAIARDILGVCAEIAVARWLDKFPTSLFADRKEGDVGEYEVRSTAYPYGKLLFQPDDNPERKYFLVTIDDHYQALIMGWLWGHEGLQDKYWDTSMPVPCYAVKQQHLRDPEDLD